MRLEDYVTRRDEICRITLEGPWEIVAALERRGWRVLSWRHGNGNEPEQYIFVAEYVTDSTVAVPGICVMNVESN